MHPSAPAPRRTRPFRIAAIGGGLCIALLIAELILRFFAPLADPLDPSRWIRLHINKQHPANATLRFKPEPGLPGMQGTSRWTTNEYGFRGDALVSPKPANEFRIFLIDGSTAECLILDDCTSSNQSGPLSLFRKRDFLPVHGPARCA